MEEEGWCLCEMKHKEERTTDTERNGRSQERVERQAAEWINSERGRHKRILQISGQGMGKQVRECRRAWGCYMVSQSPFIYLLDYFSGLFLIDIFKFFTLSYLFIASLLRYNSHAIKSIFLKCLIQ